MPTLEEIAAEVDELDGPEGNTFRFRDVFRKIETASQRADSDQGTLVEIISSFRDKIPDLIPFNRIRSDAKDLAESIMISDLHQRIANIKDRNDTLASLTARLQTQIAKANSDASRLTRIKNAVEKATKTIDEVKDLISDLQVTDATTKQKLKTLIEHLGTISSIFEPQEA